MCLYITTALIVLASDEANPVISDVNIFAFVNNGNTQFHLNDRNMQAKHATKLLPKRLANNLNYL